MAVSIPRHHADWLSLIEISGPFLSMSELLRVFPQGLEEIDSDTRGELKAGYEEWLDNRSSLRPEDWKHEAWILHVLRAFLGLDNDALGAQVLTFDQAIPPNLKLELPEHGETVRPDFVIHDPDEPAKPRMLVQMYSAQQGLERQIRNARWQASPATRMMELLHATGVRIGLVTNGEQWMLVDAPRGETTGYISWYANLWMEERITLRAFYSLFNVGRFFGFEEDFTLEYMLAESANDQQEVTDQLGYQVREAVEILIQAIDRVDEKSGRVLLQNVDEARLYESALTVMMRLVFLMSAEERGLFLLGDPIYDQYYAVSTLRGQLRESADRAGEDVLQFRYDAWSRLLATFRAVHGGIQHEDLRLPAYGGSLFDPDRYSFLEGRQDGTHWRTTEARPLEISNRTVLHLLEALQILQVKVPGGGGAEARRLSFRALDIEQIGHVYEGLLDHQAQRAEEVIIGLEGTKHNDPEIPLTELEARDGDALIEFLQNETGRSESAIRNRYDVEQVDDDLRRMLLVSCGNDQALFTRIYPYAELLRTDSSGYPMVIREGSMYVTAGTTRRATGTHYTPRSLTEPIVQHTLEPLVYTGPAEGHPREEWQLKSPAELLDLKICDMAMGSGAFLVQTVRYLSERLLEAWQVIAPEGGLQITPEGKPAQGRPEETIIPDDPDERLILAKRLIADRCIYGVDKNPLAVEMGKLSLWLITLQKGRPFTFLDHALKCGDSLVGVDLEQLRYWSLNPDGEQEQFISRLLEPMIERAINLRRQIEAFPVLDIRDQQEKARLLQQAENATAVLKTAADHLIAEVMGVSSGSILSDVVDLFKAIQSGKDWEDVVRDNPLPPADELEFTPFHWELEFPEVFLSHLRGFSSFIGNPPFVHGSRISTNFGKPYLNFLVNSHSDALGSADLCTNFFRQANQHIHSRGTFGLIATDSINEADNRSASLEPIVKSGTSIIRALTNFRWPGQANLNVSYVVFKRGTYKGQYVIGEEIVPRVSIFLDDAPQDVLPYQLQSRSNFAFKGVDTGGMGFVVTDEEYEEIAHQEPQSLDKIWPLLNGRDLLSDPSQKASRRIVNFTDLSLEQARQYPALMRIVETRVLPDRKKARRKRSKKYWWLYKEPSVTLYSSIADLDYCMVNSVVSKYIVFGLIETKTVFTNALNVFSTDSMSWFCNLHSSLHEAWVRYYGSSLGKTNRYNVTDCIGTYPAPDNDDSLIELGHRYYITRQRIMQNNEQGLTDTYNRFHDPGEGADDIEELRQLHVEMDEAVAVAYGWDDLDLGHDFHETAQGIRFTISEAARREVLTRLLKLNHQRYREELLQGLHKAKDVKAWLKDHPEDAAFLSAGKVPMKKKPKKKQPPKQSKQSNSSLRSQIRPFGSDDGPSQLSMFGDEDDE